MAMLHRVASGQHHRAARAAARWPTRCCGCWPSIPTARPPMRAVADELARVHAAILDPASGEPTHRIDPTQRMARRPCRPRPPTTTVTLPAVGPRQAVRPPFDAGRSAPGPARGLRRRPTLPRPTAGTPEPAAPVAARSSGGRRRSSCWPWRAILATQLRGNDSRQRRGGKRTSSSRPVHPRRKRTASSKPASRTRSQQRRNSESTAPRPRSPPPAHGAERGGRRHRAASCRRRCSDYYSLLPDEHRLRPGNRLTPAYQTQAGGRTAATSSFWRQFRSVTASNVRVNGDTGVRRRSTYVAKNGAWSTETRSFNLVRAGRHPEDRRLAGLTPVTPLSAARCGRRRPAASPTAACRRRRPRRGWRTGRTARPTAPARAPPRRWRP